MKKTTKVAAFFCSLATLTMLIILITNSIQSDKGYQVEFPPDSLVYVAEVTRHGARAPLDGAGGFPVATQQLTPMGMRQRYLLGRYYYEKFWKTLIGNDAKKDPPVSFFDNLWVASTDVNRTIQSANSQFLGFTEETRKGNTPKLTTAQQQDFVSGGARGLQTFQVRNITSASEALGDNAIQSVYSGQPLHVTVAQSRWMWNNDLNWENCAFASSVFNRRKVNDTVYRDHLYLRDNLRDDYAVEFDLTDTQKADMSFLDAYHYADAVTSMLFEGVPTKQTYEGDKLFQVHTTQIYGLMDPYTTKARALFISKFLERILADIRGFQENKEIYWMKPAQYMMYSGHDDDISNMLRVLVPQYNFTFIPYASTIVFEINRSTDNSHYIKMTYNGETMNIENCADVQNKGCNTQDFISSITNSTVIADDERLKTKCAAVPVWPADFVDDGDPHLNATNPAEEVFLRFDED